MSQTPRRSSMSGGTNAFGKAKASPKRRSSVQEQPKAKPSGATARRASLQTSPKSVMFSDEPSKETKRRASLPEQMPSSPSGRVSFSDQLSGEPLPTSPLRAVPKVDLLSNDDSVTPESSPVPQSSESSPLPQSSAVSPESFPVTPVMPHGDSRAVREANHDEQFPLPLPEAQAQKHEEADHDEQLPLPISEAQAQKHEEAGHVKQLPLPLPEAKAQKHEEDVCLSEASSIQASTRDAALGGKVLEEETNLPKVTTLGAKLFVAAVDDVAQSPGSVMSRVAQLAQSIESGSMLVEPSTNNVASGVECKLRPVFAAMKEQAKSLLDMLASNSKEENMTLQEHRISFDTNRSCLFEQVRSLEANKSDLEKTLKSLEASLLVEKAGSAGVRSTLQQKINSLEASLQVERDGNAIKSHLEQKIESLEASLQGVEGSSDGLVSGLEQRVSKLGAANQALESALQFEKDRCAELEKVWTQENEGLTQQVRSLETSLQAEKDRSDKNRRQSCAAGDAVTRMDTEVRGLKQKIAEDQQKVLSIDRARSQEEQKIFQLTLALSRREADNEKLHALLKASETKLDQAQENQRLIQDLEQAKGQNGEVIFQFQAALYQKDSDIHRLQQLLAASASKQSQAQHLQDLCDELGRARSEDQERISHLTADLSQLTATVNQLTTALSKKESEMIGLERWQLKQHRDLNLEIQKYKTLLQQEIDRCRKMALKLKEQAELHQTQVSDLSQEVKILEEIKKHDEARSASFDMFLNHREKDFEKLNERLCQTVKQTGTGEFKELAEKEVEYLRLEVIASHRALESQRQVTGAVMAALTKQGLLQRKGREKGAEHDEAMLRVKEACVEQAAENKRLQELLLAHRVFCQRIFAQHLDVGPKSQEEKLIASPPAFFETLGCKEPTSSSLLADLNVWAPSDFEKLIDDSLSPQSYPQRSRSQSSKAYVGTSSPGAGHGPASEALGQRPANGRSMSPTARRPLASSNEWRSLSPTRCISVPVPNCGNLMPAAHRAALGTGQIPVGTGQIPVGTFTSGTTNFVPPGNIPPPNIFMHQVPILGHQTPRMYG